MNFDRRSSRRGFLIEHDLRANAVHLPRGKAASRPDIQMRAKLSGPCFSRCKGGLKPHRRTDGGTPTSHERTAELCVAARRPLN
jgi:hypothetical protein